jgi:UDP-N-acetyl-D-mannosaminuronate dehydrogenase
MEVKHVCTYFLHGSCKYKNKCNKIHLSPTTELLEDIEKKGTAICNFYPNCKFTKDECRRLHVDVNENTENVENGTTVQDTNDNIINKIKELYITILKYENNSDEAKVAQVNRIKYLMANDLDLLKNTVQCLSS